MITVPPEERISRARSAQSHWAKLPVKTRCKVLRALRRQAASQTEKIVQILSEETGKPALDALGGDVLVTLEQMRYYEKYAPRLLQARRIGKPSLLYFGAHFKEMFEPHGVALIYAPSNYPFQLSVVPTITALVAGNAVILKCSERTPRCARCISDLCRDANLPTDLVQVVDDPPEQASALIDAGPDLIFFTGSSEHGASVAQRAAGRLIPTVLELGGKDPAIVFADCNFERTIEGVVYGAFSNAGQVCVGIKRLYVEHSIFDRFLDRLTERALDLRVGSEPDSDLGLLQGSSARIRLVSQVEDALERGATLHLPKCGSLSGCEPTVLSGVPPDSRLLTEETFGPVICVSAFQDEAEAVMLANASPFALSGSIWTADLARGRRIAAQMRAGACSINDVIRNIANPCATFGGNMRSGYGRYHGPQGLYTFSRVKSVMTIGDRRKHEVHWFPSSQKELKSLTKVLAFRHRTGDVLGRIRQFLFPVLLCLLFPIALCAEASHPAHLFIHVTAPANLRGAVAYLVLRSKNGFPNDKAKALRSGFVAAPGSASQMTIDAGELPPGRYAVSVYEDVNRNRKLDKNFLGIPTEPVGASNNPKTRMGPPKFDRCAFQMGDSNRTISIRLVH